MTSEELKSELRGVVIQRNELCRVRLSASGEFRAALDRLDFMLSMKEMFIEQEFIRSNLEPK